MSRAKLFLLLFIILLFPFFSIFAFDPLGIVINEVAWMGTKIFPSDEWIELYNNLEFPIALRGWILVAEDGIPEIKLEGNIPAKGFFLLERTDDKTITTIKADLIYKGALHNQGEYLKLFDSKGNLVDEINCSSEWFEGKGTPDYKTMERINSLVLGNNPDNWQTSQNSGGTPKEKNSLVEIEVKSEQQIEPASTSFFTETITNESELITYPSNIFINEILPSAEGPDSENEWIELFNGTNFEVDLSGWQIKDTLGAIKVYTFPNGTRIESNGFLVLPRPKTKITLQNSGDGLELIQPDGNIIDTVTYGKAPLGQSFNRASEKWNWSTTLTPGESNIITCPEIYKTESLKISEEKEDQTKYPQSIEEEELLTAKIRTSLRSEIGEKFSEPSNPLILFLIATTIAIFSGIIVLFLKKKTEETE